MNKIADGGAISRYLVFFHLPTRHM